MHTDNCKATEWRRSLKIPRIVVLEDKKDIQQNESPLNPNGHRNAELVMATIRVAGEDFGDPEAAGEDGGVHGAGKGSLNSK